jgi:hypothetical protein
VYPSHWVIRGIWSQNEKLEDTMFFSLPTRCSSSMATLMSPKRDLASSRVALDKLPNGVD